MHMAFFFEIEEIYTYPWRHEFQGCKVDEESGKNGQFHLMVVHAMKMRISFAQILFIFKGLGCDIKSQA